MCFRVCSSLLLDSAEKHHFFIQSSDFINAACLNAEDGHIPGCLDIPEIEILCDIYLYFFPVGALPMIECYLKRGMKRRTRLLIKCDSAEVRIS
jgi:hypothetical protein